MLKRILVVDDNEAIRRALRRLFGGHKDFEICGESTNGQDAIEKVCQLNPDLVILDLSMPVMNGLEAARILRKTKPEIPIILLTLHGNSLAKSEAQAAGIRVVVSKVDMSGLLDQARALFKNPEQFKTSSSSEI